jgi:hypothetical protein
MFPIHRSSGLALLCLLAVAGFAQPAFALITGGEGNDPLDDPGWFKGAEVVFNDRTRVAWWEGPPFGGGEYHGEYKGDADDLQRMLDGLAQIHADHRRVVLRDGSAESFWLTTLDKSREHPVDWTFTVWVPERFEIQRGWSVGDNAEVPAPVIEVYLGRGLDWSAIELPEGIELEDQTLAAHGFTLEDGAVLQGTILEVGSNTAIAGAKVTLELIEPSEEGGYEYSDTVSVESDADGKWTIRQAPDGWYQVVTGKEGYLPRIVGYAQFEGEPGWHSYDTRLARAAEITGVVVDSAGIPIAGASVRLDDLKDATRDLYNAQTTDSLTTDGEGRFSTIVLEGGTFSPWVHLDGYVQIGLPDPYTVGSGELRITLHQSGNVRVRIDFSDRVSTGDYLVEVEPEGGSEIGSWGGSANVDENGSYLFENVPPGRYTFRGRPNPGSADEETDPKTVEVLAGETVDVVLMAKP